jgi:transcriptional regulator with XRE-family HTH domain
MKKDDIAKRLKVLRGTMGISQKELCEKIDYSQANYSRMEKGQTALNFQILFHLFSEFGVNVHWLFSGEGNMFLGKQSKDNPSPEWEKDFSKSFPNIPLGEDTLFLFQTINDFPSIRFEVLKQLVHLKNEEIKRSANRHIEESSYSRRVSG